MLIYPRQNTNQVPIYRPRMPSLANGIIGWWNFDDGQAQDVSGFNNNGSFVNGPALVGGLATLNGRSGLARAFNGTNQTITTPQSTGYTIDTQPISIAFWIKVLAGSTSQQIIGTAIDTNNFDGIWYQWGSGSFNTSPVNSLTFGFLDNSGAFGKHYASTGSILPTGLLVHAVTTYTGNGSSTGISIYINGFPVSLSGTDAGSFTNMTARSWRIGSTADSQQFFDGVLDDVRIYNRAMSAGEVLALYAESFQPAADFETIALMQTTVAAAVTLRGSQSMVMM